MADSMCGTGNVKDPEDFIIADRKEAIKYY